MNDLITLTELCRRLNLKPSRIYYLTHIEGIPHFKIGQNLRFDPAEIEDWLKKKHRDANTPGVNTRGLKQG
jgi:excisionase family DNA binding protein